MFVSCSTLCFARLSLEAALRQIAELEFDKYELALIEDGDHMRPSEASDNQEAALQRLRSGPSLVPSALHVDFGPAGWDGPAALRRFENACRMAKALSVAVISVLGAPAGAPLSQEAARLTRMVATATREGLVLAPITHTDTLMGDPRAALELCKTVPGLGLTLDPSHFLQSAQPRQDFDALFPFVQNIHLRDTGQAPGEFQVRVGQGQVDYARIVTLLRRHGYNRALTINIIDRPDNPFDREIEVRKLKLLLETLI